MFCLYTLSYEGDCFQSHKVVAVSKEKAKLQQIVADAITQYHNFCETNLGNIVHPKDNPYPDGSPRFEIFEVKEV